MRKRDALRIALRPPKLEEWEKLHLAGMAILSISALLASVLMLLTRDFMWIILFLAGLLIYLWFREASLIMREWMWLSP